MQAILIPKRKRMVSTLVSNENPHKERHNSNNVSNADMLTGTHSNRGTDKRGSVHVNTKLHITAKFDPYAESHHSKPSELLNIQDFDHFKSTRNPIEISKSYGDMAAGKREGNLKSTAFYSPHSIEQKQRPHIYRMRQQRQRPMTSTNPVFNHTKRTSLLEKTI